MVDLRRGDAEAADGYCGRRGRNFASAGQAEGKFFKIFGDGIYILYTTKTFGVLIFVARFTNPFKTQSFVVLVYEPILWSVILSSQLVNLSIPNHLSSWFMRELNIIRHPRV